MDGLSYFLAMTQYCKETGRSYRQAADILQTDTSKLSKYRFLTDLPEEAQGYVRARTLPADTGIAIAKGFKDSPDEMVRLAKEAVAGRLTAKQVREMTSGNGKPEAPKITWPKNWTAEQKIEWHRTEAKKLGAK